MTSPTAATPSARCRSATPRPAISRATPPAGWPPAASPLSPPCHLPAAPPQGTTAASIVVSALPGRDCAALASNGELPATEAGLTTYETQYIYPLAAAIAAPPNLRVIAIIEPDSLPN